MQVKTEIGLERLQRAVVLLMAQNINTEIAAQNALWDTRDSEFYSEMGRTNPAFSLETIAPDNFYSGVIPSLIAAPLSAYPNCCVIAYIGTPLRSDDDWSEMYGVTLAVELMVKSVKSEEEVNARIQRTLEAAHSVLTSDKNRRIPEGNTGVNLVNQIANTPSVTIGDVFVRQEGTDPNDRWFWQGGRMQYQIEKLVSY